MSFPEHIAKGFNFDEAIEMTELCRRVYKIFDESTAKDAHRLYEALYNDEWNYVHGISDYETDGRCMILKKKNRNQYAVVFRGSIVTGQGLELTNLAAGVEDKMIDYERIPYEPTPPPRNTKVHQGYMKTFNGFKDELIFFFEILAGSELEPSLLVGLVESDTEECASRIAALCGAIGVKFGPEVKERVLHTLSNTVHKIKHGDLSLSDVSLNDFVSKEVRFNRVLKELSQQNDDGSSSDDERMEVYVTGHSLGGALATLGVLFLKRYFASQSDFPPTILKKYTIGSPKVGNKIFVDYYNKQMKDFSYRIQNQVDPVVYGPNDPVPAQYMLPLMMPGVDHVRVGDEYYAFYQHVGEAYTLFGMGHQKLDLDFGGPLKFSLPLPFPHGPDGYKDMLIETREREERWWKPVKNVFSTIFGEQREQLASLEKRVVEVQKAIEKLQK